jgi:hypothetical protein
MPGTNFSNYRNDRNTQQEVRIVPESSIGEMPITRSNKKKESVTIMDAKTATEAKKETRDSPKRKKTRNHCHMKTPNTL